MKYWLKVIFTPACWIRNGAYSEAFDAELTRLLDNGATFENYDRFTAQIGHLTLWVENHPYASFTPYDLAMNAVRPSRATILRAHEHFVKDVVIGHSK